MMGRRLPDGQHPVSPGDYSLVGGVWWAKVPAGGSAGSLENHTVTEHADRTITVSPSILREAEAWRNVPQWHGYLERGVWREG